MTATTVPPFFDPDEPAPVSLVNPDGAADFLLACDHAGNAIPRRLGTLGLPDGELQRHMAWDIGVAGLGRELSRRLDAPLLLQTYSRLVVDCNRDPAVPSSIPEVSETTRIPGNVGISAVERAARLSAIFEPYHATLQAALDGRAADGRQTVLVALHSFTPVFKGVGRPWQVGILFNRDTRLARPLIALLRAEGDLVVGENEPYSVSDVSDYTVPVHGERRGLFHVEIEIRQDLIAEPAGQAAWAARLARLLPVAWEACRGRTTP